MDCHKLIACNTGDGNNRYSNFNYIFINQNKRLSMNSNLVDAIALGNYIILSEIPNILDTYTEVTCQALFCHYTTYFILTDLGSLIIIYQKKYIEDNPKELPILRMLSTQCILFMLLSERIPVFITNKNTLLVFYDEQLNEFELLTPVMYEQINYSQVRITNMQHIGTYYNNIPTMWGESMTCVDSLLLIKYTYKVTEEFTEEGIGGTLEGIEGEEYECREETTEIKTIANIYQIGKRHGVCNVTFDIFDETKQNMIWGQSLLICNGFSSTIHKSISSDIDLNFTELNRPAGPLQKNSMLSHYLKECTGIHINHKVLVMSLSDGRIISSHAFTPFHRGDNYMYVDLMKGGYTGRNYIFVIVNRSLCNLLVWNYAGDDEFINRHKENIIHFSNADFFIPIYYNPFVANNFERFKHLMACPNNAVVVNFNNTITVFQGNISGYIEIDPITIPENSSVYMGIAGSYI